jgi:4-hydroxybenzoate polyprenyltransferase
MVLSLIGPLGLKGSAIHALGLLSATAYNFRLKKTRISVLPYVFSFGALPWAIFLAAGKHPSFWLYLGFMVFASAFHFLNVMKDLDWDISQGILGLPQILGRKRSIAVAGVLLSCGLVLVVVKWHVLIKP